MLPLRACLYGGGGLGGPTVGEVTFDWALHQSYKRDQIKTRDYSDRRVTLRTWGRPPTSM